MKHKPDRHGMVQGDLPKTEGSGGQLWMDDLCTATCEEDLISTQYFVIHVIMVEGGTSQNFQ